jgi:dihydroflavonol-4-reductase
MISLVTGATGFVGAALARRLVAAGHDVRVLVRPASDRRNLAGLRVEVSEGDLLDPGSLAAALKGCDFLFHAAADYRLWVPNPQTMYRTNVDGTRDVMLGALKAGVKRVVYTSSVATLGSRADEAPADEETPSRLDAMIGPYKRSKFLAEAEVARLVRDQGLPAVIVNPSAPVGPGDIKPTPTGRAILDAAAGRMPAYVATGLNVVHVDDVALGHLLALERGRIGQRYILGGTNMTLKEILDAVCTVAGVPGPRLRIPHGAAFAAAFLMEGWARFAGGAEPRATMDAVRMARKPMYFSSEKATRELGYAPRAAEAAVRDAVAWFRRTGYLGG